VILLVQTMLGLTPLAPRSTLMVDPALPEWLPEITLRNFRVGASRTSLKFHREPNGRTAVEVIDSGGLYIARPAASIKRGADRVAITLAAALQPTHAIRLSGNAPSL